MGFFFIVFSVLQPTFTSCIKKCKSLQTLSLYSDICQCFTDFLFVISVTNVHFSHYSQYTSSSLLQLYLNPLSMTTLMRWNSSCNSLAHLTSTCKLTELYNICSIPNFGSVDTSQQSVFTQLARQWMVTQSRELFTWDTVTVWQCLEEKHHKLLFYVCVCRVIQQNPNILVSLTELIGGNLLLFTTLPLPTSTSNLLCSQRSVH